MEEKEIEEVRERRERREIERSPVDSVIDGNQFFPSLRKTFFPPSGSDNS